MVESGEPAIYLDYAAATPIDPRVAEVMAAHLRDSPTFANPASGHAHGRRAADAVERARERLAATVGAEPAEIVWTSGATESDNLAVMGAARFYGGPGDHVVTARTEHKAVLEAAAALERDGFRVTRLSPAADGRVGPEQVRAALTERTVLVSVMHVNNELGAIQDIDAIGAVCRKHGVRLHVDAAQSAGRLALDMARSPVDYLSLSAHKVYGPKGAGALYVRRRPPAALRPVLLGGGQEGGLRPGTPAVHQVAGMAEALALGEAERDRDSERMTALAGRFRARLADAAPFTVNAEDAPRVPHILSLTFPHVEGEALRAALPDLAVGSGAACASAAGESSYVLRALGHDPQLAGSSLRVSFGRMTTEAEVDAAAQRLTDAVRWLRELSPLADACRAPC